MHVPVLYHCMVLLGSSAPWLWIDCWLLLRDNYKLQTDDRWSMSIRSGGTSKKRAKARSKRKQASKISTNSVDVRLGKHTFITWRIITFGTVPYSTFISSHILFFICFPLSQFPGHFESSHFFRGNYCPTSERPSPFALPTVRYRNSSTVLCILFYHTCC